MRRKTELALKAGINMNNNKLWIIGLILVVGGCSTRVTHIDVAKPVTPVVTQQEKYELSSLQLFSVEMTKKMLLSPVIKAITQKQKPIIIVEAIKNRTPDRIDTQEMTDIINAGLLASGSFRFVDEKRINELRKQLDFEANDALVNPGTAIQFGKMAGAQYILYGNINDVFDDNINPPQRIYKVTLRLMELDSGIIEWSEQFETVPFE